MVHIKPSLELRKLVRAVEAKTQKQVLDQSTDKVGCVVYEQISEFFRMYGEESDQDGFTKLVRFEDLVMAVEHRQMMQVANESEKTKKLREYLRLKRERREVNEMTGRKPEPENSPDKSLGNYEKSIKFAMTFLFAMFSSSIGGYFAAKAFFGLDHTYVGLDNAVYDHRWVRDVRKYSCGDRTLYHEII